MLDARPPKQIANQIVISSLRNEPSPPDEPLFLAFLPNSHLPRLLTPLKQHVGEPGHLPASAGDQNEHQGPPRPREAQVDDQGRPDRSLRLQDARELIPSWSGQDAIFALVLL